MSFGKRRNKNVLAQEFHSYKTSKNTQCFFQVSKSNVISQAHSFPANICAFRDQKEHGKVKVL